MDTNQEVRRAFLDLGLYSAKHPEQTTDWIDICRSYPKDAQHNVVIVVKPGTLEKELANKNDLLMASGIVGLVSDVTFEEATTKINARD